MILARLAGLALSMGTILLDGSSSPPVIDDADVVTVLTLAVRAAVSSDKLASDSCFSSNIKPTSIRLVEGNGRWMQQFKIDYRVLRAPKFETLPAAAFAAVPVAKRGARCTHPIIFNPVEFVQISESGVTSTHAFIDFGDMCALCGSGYQMALVNSAGHWKVEEPGITSTWVS